jgi:hypothetical protein
MSVYSDTLSTSFGNFGVRYPSPFFEIAAQYMPPTVQKRHGWCEYYINNDPLIHTAVRRMSEYPITELEVEGKNTKQQNFGQRVLEKLNIKAYCINIGLHYYGIGDAFPSIQTKFLRSLICHNCLGTLKLDDPILRFQLKPEIRNSKVTWVISHCPRCKRAGTGSIKDTPITTMDSIILGRWDPKNIEIDYNPISGMKQYYYVVPKLLQRKILAGDIFYIKTTPKIILEAAVKNRKVLMHDGVFQFSRATNSCTDNGWGEPLVGPVLKELFQVQIAKRAREAILQQHIVPLWIMFPSPQGEGSPFQHLNLGVWRTRIEQEFKKWRRDPNYIPIMPMPLGFQYVGGDMSKLDPSKIIDAMEREIVAGMGIPVEFLFGGSSYSSSTILLRMLENQFLNFRSLMTDFMNSVLIPRVCQIINAEPFTVRFTKLRMMDDVQQKQLAINLNATGKLSDHSLLTDVGGFDYETEQRNLDEQFKNEDKRIAERMKRQAAVQKELGLTALRSQAEMGKQQQVDTGLMDPQAMVNAHADTLAKMDPVSRGDIMKQMSVDMPEYSTAVTQQLNTKSVSMKPAPAQKPPKKEA